MIAILIVAPFAVCAAGRIPLSMPCLPDDL